jgi:hypothetical protein
MEFYSALKNNEILSFAGKWMKLKNIILMLASFRKPKAACFLTYVENRPKTNTLML